MPRYRTNGPHARGDVSLRFYGAFDGCSEEVAEIAEDDQEEIVRAKGWLTAPEDPQPGASSRRRSTALPTEQFRRTVNHSARLGRRSVASQPTITAHSRTSEEHKTRSAAYPVHASVGRIRMNPKKRAPSNKYRLKDRFVPARSFDKDSRESSVVSTPPKELAQFEKITRQDSYTQDPFGPRPHRPLRTSERILDVYGSYPARLHAPPGLATAHRAANGMMPSHRAFSSNSVFSVGGSRVLVDGVHSISDGRGRRITSGTNATLHVSDFFSKGEPAEDKNMFRRRLAAAFE